jgi:hypothetical protein
MRYQRLPIASASEVGSALHVPDRIPTSIYSITVLVWSANSLGVAVSMTSEQDFLKLRRRTVRKLWQQQNGAAQDDVRQCEVVCVPLRGTLLPTRQRTIRSNWERTS